MSRYVNVEPLVLELIDTAQSSSRLHPGIMTAVYKIRACPAADVRPERHGEWVRCDDGLYECSECGEVTGANFYKFCPDCGAKMDGAKEGDEDNPYEHKVR